MRGECFLSSTAKTPNLLEGTTMIPGHLYGSYHAGGVGGREKRDAVQWINLEEKR